MLFPIRNLIEGHPKLVTIHRNSSIRDALTLMIQNDYSQLPVVDQQGCLCGLVSDESIIKLYFHTNGNVHLTNVKVSQCMQKVRLLSPDSDIFEALDLLEDSFAVVIVDNHKPISILTNYDLTHFFRDLSEGMIIVEDIEVSLKSLFSEVFPDNDDFQNALLNAVGPHQSDPTKPSRDTDQMTFKDLILMVTKNWKNFETIFENRDLFINIMEPIREIRNQLAHFRGRLEAIQFDALNTARNWLEQRLSQYQSTQLVVQSARITIQSQVSQLDHTKIKSEKYGGKYYNFHRWLVENRSSSPFSLSFKDIEQINGENLPDSARIHRAWWSNDYNAHTQSRAWMNAGYLAEQVDMEKEQLVFRPSITALYPQFFDALIKQTKALSPSIIRNEKVSTSNWFSFGSGVSGFSFGWVLPKEPVLRIDFDINLGRKELNEKAFDYLFERKNSIEKQIGLPLEWDRKDDAQVSRISAKKPFSFTDSQEQQEQTIIWAVHTMIKFVSTFQNYLPEIS